MPTNNGEKIRAVSESVVDSVGSAELDRIVLELQEIRTSQQLLTQAVFAAVEELQQERAKQVQRGRRERSRLPCTRYDNLDQAGPVLDVLLDYALLFVQMGKEVLCFLEYSLLAYKAARKLKRRINE